MKYVRTKDGIFEVIGERENFVRVKFSGTQGVDIHKEMIKNRSDSIKDLCNAFVNVEIAGGFEGEFHVYKDLELAKYAADEKVTEIYGAIRTDKGLIYVAKLNDKGKLELL